MRHPAVVIPSGHSTKPHVCESQTLSVILFRHVSLYITYIRMYYILHVRTQIHCIKCYMDVLHADIETWFGRLPINV